MDAGSLRAALPQCAAVLWATPTEDGKSRYVVGFGRDLERTHLDVLSHLIRQHGGFTGVEIGPLPNQATVFFSSSDIGHTRLDWLKQWLKPQAVGTVIIDLYLEADPVVARFTALGVYRFCDDDLPGIRGVAAVDSATLSGGVVTVTFCPDLVELNGREALVEIFVTQQEFAVTAVVKPGTPDA